MLSWASPPTEDSAWFSPPHTQPPQDDQGNSRRLRPGVWESGGTQKSPGLGAEMWVRCCPCDLGRPRLPPCGAPSCVQFCSETNFLCLGGTSASMSWPCLFPSSQPSSSSSRAHPSGSPPAPWWGKGRKEWVLRAASGESAGPSPAPASTAAWLPARSLLSLDFSSLPLSSRDALGTRMGLWEKTGGTEHTPLSR